MQAPGNPTLVGNWINPLKTRKPRYRSDPKWAKQVTLTCRRKHGHIEGIQVGDTFKDRRELYMAGGHNRTRAGICGDAKEGLFAIVA